MGLENETPQGINTETLPVRVKAIRAEKKLKLGGDQVIAFDTEKHLLLHKDQTLPQHPNGMRFSAFGANGEMLATTEYFSIGACMAPGPAFWAAGAGVEAGPPVGARPGPAFWAAGAGVLGCSAGPSFWAAGAGVLGPSRLVVLLGLACILDSSRLFLL